MQIMELFHCSHIKSNAIKKQTINPLKLHFVVLYNCDPRIYLCLLPLSAAVWFSATGCILDLCSKICNVLKHIITNRDIRKVKKMMEKLFPCSDEDSDITCRSEETLPLDTFTC